MDKVTVDNQPLVADLISLWQRSREQGQAISVAELCRDCPDLLPELERQLADLARISALADAHETATVAPANGENQAVHEPATLDPDATRAPLGEGQSIPAIASLAEGPAVPGYELLGILGKGGMGVVYQARQRGLGRIVALKMILHAEHAGEAERQRFQAEAEAVARLQHPNIVQIYEVGEQRGLPYFSLEFCPGGSLADKLDGTPLPPKDAAILIQTLAMAMQAAHDKGILHRDLKPANVLLAEDGTPKITDFGLAKKLGEKGQTQTGAVMGTPSYMAPEQAGGSKEIGPTADIYALGAILYELLTGRPPFKAATALDTILQVMSDEPVPPTQLQSKTPPDLETICLKCLHKEPGKRYASAAALAEDLGRYLHGEPITARPVGRLERGWRWCRRYPGVAGLTAAMAMVLVISSLVAWGLAAWALGEKERADETTLETLQQKQQADASRELVLSQKKQADEARDLAELRLYGSKLAQAQIAWQDNSAASVFQRLDECPRQFRGVEYRLLWTLFNSNQRTFRGHTGPIYSVCFSPDGRRIASGSADKTVKIWDADKGQELFTLKGHTAGVRSICFSADSKRILSGCEDGMLKLWNTEMGQEILTLKGHTSRVCSVCFSADSKRILSGSLDGMMKIWDADTGQEVRTLPDDPSLGFGSECFSFSPDGKRILNGCYDKTVKVWDADSGKRLLNLQGHAQYVSSVCFSPDSKRIVSGSIDKTLKVWDAIKGKELLTLKGHPGMVMSVCFSPDGGRILSGGYEATLKVWDAYNGKELYTLRGHPGGVMSVCFSPDGKRFLSGSMDQTVKVWDSEKQQGPHILEDHTGQVFCAAFSPNGKRIISASEDKTVKVWDADEGQVLLTLKGHNAPVASACFSPDGKRILSNSPDDTSMIWNAETKRLRRNPGQTAKVWDADTGQEVLSLQGVDARVVFSPDGKRILGGYENTVKVWDAGNGKELITLQGHTELIFSVCFSPDGKRIVSGSADQTARVWDVEMGRELFTLKGHPGWVTSVCFSPDGKRILSGDSSRIVKVWDADKGQESLTLKGHTDSVSSVCFSPDGKRILSGSVDKTVKVWHADTGQELLTLKGHKGAVLCVGFSPDGNRILSSSEDKTVRVWDASLSDDPRSQ